MGYGSAKVLRIGKLCRGGHHAFGGWCCRGRVIRSGELGMFRETGDVFTLPVLNRPPARIKRGALSRGYVAGGGGSRRLEVRAAE